MTAPPVTESRGLLLVGKVRPERKRSLTGMAVAAELPLVALEEGAQAIDWLDSNDPGCVLVDAAVGRLDKVIAKLRSKRELAHVPVLALVATPDDLWIEQYFGWGGDDVVHVDAGATLLERLRAVPREAPKCHPGRSVLIGDPDRARIEVIGRIFGLAGFEVNTATDRKSLEASIEQQDPQLVLANSVLGELPELIARTRALRSQATWIVTAARRDLETQQLALASIERCAVMGAQVNPWQLLYRSNELSYTERAERRSEARRPFGSFVLFRAAGSDDDDVGVAYDLSSRGMFVRTFAPVLSEDVWLEWRVPQDKTRVRLEGRVVWRQASLTDPARAASPLGFGVEFRDYLGGARKHVERALEMLDAGNKRTSSSPAALELAAPTVSSALGSVAAAASKAVGPAAAESGAVSASGSVRPAAAPTTAGRLPSTAAENGAKPVSGSIPPAAAAKTAVRSPSPAAENGAKPVSGSIPPAAAAKAAVRSPSPGAENGAKPVSGSIPPAAAAKAAVRSPSPGAENGAKPVSGSVPPAAAPSATPGTAAKSPSLKPGAASAGAPRTSATSVRPLANLGSPDKPSFSVKPAATTALDALAKDSNKDSGKEPSVGKEPSNDAAKNTDDQGPGRTAAKSTAQGSTERSATAVSQALTKRAVLPGAPAPAALKARAANLGPPRPASAVPAVAAPPRPNRPSESELDSNGIAATPMLGNGNVSITEAPNGELKERRFDTVRDAVAFDDPVENTDPDAARELFEDAPNSSEPTEILPNPRALFGTADEQKHPLFLAGEDAPTVVTPGPAGDPSRATASSRVDAGPTADTVSDPFASEEQVTRQWRGDIERTLPQSEPDEDWSAPKRRGGTLLLTIGIFVAAAALTGVAWWRLHAGADQSKVTPAGASRESARAIERTPSSESPAAAPAEAPTPAVANVASSASAASSVSVVPGGVPWARPDDGTGVQDFPPVEDPQGGKGRLLADRYGYLVVRFPEAAYIFSDNIAMGATNWKIATPCGEKTLRIGVGEKPVTWLSDEAKVNVACRDTTRVVFERLPGVVVPPNVARPIAPGSMPARKPPSKSDATESGANEVVPAVKSKAFNPAADGKPVDGERGIVDTRE